MPLSPLHPGSDAARAALPRLALLGVLALAGCTGASFSADDLREGTCRQAADPLLQVDDSLRGLADEDLEPSEAGERFAAVQEQLAALGEAEPTVSGPLRELRTALGFARAGVASGTYGEGEEARIGAALDEVLAACGVPPRS